MKFISSIIGLVFLTTITNCLFNTLSIDNYQARKLNHRKFRDGYNHRRLLSDEEEEDYAAAHPHLQRGSSSVSESLGPKGSNPDLLSKSQPSDSEKLDKLFNKAGNEGIKKRTEAVIKSSVDVIEYCKNIYDVYNCEGKYAEDEDCKNMVLDGVETLASVVTTIAVFTGNPILAGIGGSSSMIIGLFRDEKKAKDPSYVQRIQHEMKVLKSKIDNLGEDIKRETALIRARTEELFINQDFKNQLRELNKDKNLVKVFRAFREYVNDDMSTDFKGDVRGSILFYMQTIENESIRKIAQLKQIYDNYERDHYQNHLWHYHKDLVGGLDKDFATWIDETVENENWSYDQKDEYLMKQGHFICLWASLVKELIDSYGMYALAWEATLVLPVLTYNTSAAVHTESISHMKCLLDQSERNLYMIKQRIERIIKNFKKDFKFIESPTFAQQSVMRGIIYNSEINQDFYFLMDRANLGRNAMDTIKSIGDKLSNLDTTNQIIAIKSQFDGSSLKAIINNPSRWRYPDEPKQYIVTFDMGNKHIWEGTKKGKKEMEQMQIRLFDKRMHQIAIKTTTNRFITFDSDLNKFITNASDIESALKFQVVVNMDSNGHYQSLLFRLCHEDNHILTRIPSDEEIGAVSMNIKQEMLKQNIIRDIYQQFYIDDTTYSGSNTVDFNQAMINVMNDHKWWVLRSKKGNYFMHCNGPKWHDNWMEGAKKVIEISKGYKLSGANVFRILQDPENPAIVRLYIPMENYGDAFVHFYGDMSQDNLYWENRRRIPNQQTFQIEFNRQDKYIYLYHIYSKKYVTFEQQDGCNLLKLKSAENITDDETRQWELIPIVETGYWKHGPFGRLPSYQ